VTAKAVPVSEEWLHEPKLDDYRLQVEKPATRYFDQRRRQRGRDSHRGPDGLLSQMPIRLTVRARTPTSESNGVAGHKAHGMP